MHSLSSSWIMHLATERPIIRLSNDAASTASRIAMKLCSSASSMLSLKIVMDASTPTVGFCPFSSGRNVTLKAFALKSSLSANCKEKLTFRQLVLVVAVIYLLSKAISQFLVLRGYFLQRRRS